MADISNVLTLEVSEAFVEAVSPTIAVTDNGDGTYTVAVTDVNGTQNFTVGISAITFNNDYTMTITLPDGTSYTSGSLRGAQGETGNGIASATLNSNYTLTLTFTDGSTYTTGSIRGAKGDTGNGIASAVLNNDYTLTITYTDGTTYTTPSIRGATGATGNGISSVYKTGESGTNPRIDEYTVLYTDSSYDTFTVTNGIKGDTGATPDFSIGTVTTGAVGANAAATITGTDENPVLNLTLPRGATGDTTNIADVFSSSKAYAAGEYVIYNDLLYVFTAAHAAGAWSGSDATQVTVGEELTSQKNDYESLGLSVVDGMLCVTYEEV